MMQKTFTIFAFSLLLSSGLFAQNLACVPGFITQDTSIILPEPYSFDDMTGGLDSTCAGLVYEQVLTTLVPQSIPFAGAEIAIDSISIDLQGAISGLPPGLTYACNPPSCVFLPDSTACFVIRGTVDPDVEPRIYDLTLRLRAYNFIFPTGAVITYPDDLGNENESYFIHVSSQADCNVTVSTSELQRELSASINPNPTSDFAQLSIQATTAKDVEIMIMDVMGRVYRQQSHRLEAGQNVIPFQLNDLGQGIYFMNITDGKEFLSQKVVIEK